ncbi:ROK family transcriptional regulator [Falsiroseomonas selenitidurans]|uniref:ROK family transcriptional regulator n=1 Tax=Falsiroseomonas selenitidurans TaxID=2716335 RepID=A0ABX1EFG5_9PROT|nr:ROK family transcriptional regulator [Falsiroseomonas selenitidurans]NKC34267.1 ROK family transcriptional regulator [Falsiroseomonas selenitidurans]
MREHNQGLVLGYIMRRAGLSRSEIAERVGLTEAAISRITRELIDSGLVREGSTQTGTPGQRGRRLVQLLPRSSGAFFLAISLSISDRRVALVDLAGERLAEARLPGALPRSYPALLDAIVGAVQQFLSGTNLPRARLLGLAAVTSGAVDSVAGRILDASLDVLRGRDLADDLGGRLNLPVVVDTVGRALGMAEALLAMRGNGTELRGPSFVGHVAFGLGTTILFNGVPVRSVADERLAGHIQVPGAQGRCVCGATGCLMTAAAGFGILGRLADDPGRAATWRDMRPHDLARAVAAANAGEARAAAVFREAGLVLGRTIFALGASVGPKRVILAGPVPEAGPFAHAAAAGLREGYERAGLAPPPLIMSRVDYLHAAELLAIVEFTLTRPLDLGPLLAAPEAPPL